LEKTIQSIIKISFTVNLVSQWQLNGPSHITKGPRTVSIWLSFVSLIANTTRQQSSLDKNNFLSFHIEIYLLLRNSANYSSRWWFSYYFLTTTLCISTTSASWTTFKFTCKKNNIQIHIVNNTKCKTSSCCTTKTLAKCRSFSNINIQFFNQYKKTNSFTFKSLKYSFISIIKYIKFSFGCDTTYNFKNQ